MVVQSDNATKPYDAFGLIRTTFRGLGWKTLTFFETAVHSMSPSACPQVPYRMKFAELTWDVPEYAYCPGPPGAFKRPQRFP